jgi:glycogen debranching enzyme
MRLLPILMIAAPLIAAEPEITRPVRSWEFVDATGPRAAFFGLEDGTFEAYVYPLKILKDLRLEFQTGDQRIPAASVARSIQSRPGSYTIVYAGDQFQVEQTIAASMTEAGLVMRLRARCAEPLRIDGRFTRDFQLMWPASFGSAYSQWSRDSRAWLFGADGEPFAAVFGSPDMEQVDAEYATNYSSQSFNAFTLGTIKGTGERWLALAGSVHSRDEALAIYKRLIAAGSKVLVDADAYYRSYLERTVALELPDAMLQRAYDWARVSLVKGMVDNPLMGRGLVAGYGLSKGGYRPGFAWFFGRDAFWSSLALTSQGDCENARAAIEFVAKFQREDGKMPHEISQSATLVDWFKRYPYGFASADATPLFIIAVRDYVDHSGDVEFARRLLPRLNRAMAFLHSTLGAGGFSRNSGVGHGWVEGGPLLPVQTELYQAGCYVAALESMAVLMRALGDAGAASRFESEFKEKRSALNRLFWLPAAKAFAFALDEQGQPVNEPSVLATVPMWFRLLDEDKAQQMADVLASPEHMTPWGMRIIGAKSPKFGPAGYHFGSVWPLFTGWASVGEYKVHRAAAAFANLRANAWLALDGAGGNVTEVLSGLTYSPLSTASPHQIWSAAMVVSPLLRGLLGLSLDAPGARLTFEPHLPGEWDSIHVNGVRVADRRVSLALRHVAQYYELNVTNSGKSAVTVEFAPAFAPDARIHRATVDGQRTSWKDERHGTDFHARMTFVAKPGITTARIEHEESLRVTPPYAPPVLGQAAVEPR